MLISFMIYHDIIELYEMEFKSNILKIAIEKKMIERNLMMIINPKKKKKISIQNLMNDFVDYSII